MYTKNMYLIDVIFLRSIGGIGFLPSLFGIDISRYAHVSCKVRRTILCGQIAFIQDDFEMNSSFVSIKQRFGNSLTRKMTMPKAIMPLPDEVQSSVKLNLQQMVCYRRKFH
jgi:hypothetical protein